MKLYHCHFFVKYVYYDDGLYKKKKDNQCNAYRQRQTQARFFSGGEQHKPQRAGKKFDTEQEAPEANKAEPADLLDRRLENMKSVKTIDPLLLDFPATAAALNISVSFLHTLDNSGKIILPVKLGTRRLFSAKALSQWIDQSCPTRTEFAERDKK